MIMVTFKLVIISVSLIVIIVPNFRTVYGLGVLLEDTGDDNNSASTNWPNWQNSSDSGLEQMELKAKFKPDENPFLAEDGFYQVQKFGYRNRFAQLFWWKWKQVRTKGILGGRYILLLYSDLCNCCSQSGRKAYQSKC
jgi:hypothetical protein